MKTKYKIVETTGCTAFSFTINDKEIADIPEQEQEEILNYLFEQIKERIKENNIQLDDVIHLFHYDDYEYDNEPCEQCGDTVSTTTWNI